MMESKRLCPVCSRVVQLPRTSSIYPFCSKRCQQIDLGNWLTDTYAISEEVEDTDGIETESYRREEGNNGL